MKHIDFDVFVSKIEGHDVVESSTGKEYHIETITDGVVTILNPDVVVNQRKRIKLEDLYQAYLAIEVNALSTTNVRRYVKTGAAEATALLRTVFAYDALEEAIGDVIKALPKEKKLEMMTVMPYGIGLSINYGFEGLVRTAYALKLGSLRKCSTMNSDELLGAISECIIGEPQKFVKRLPLVDLEALKALKRSDNIMYGDTPLPLMLENIGAVASVSCDDGDEGTYVMGVNEQFMDAVKPYIDEAIAEKKATKYPIMEQAFRGILNIYGAIENDTALEMLIATLPQVDKAITEKSIRAFWKDSMLVRFCSDVESEGRILVWFGECDAAIATDDNPSMPLFWPKNAAMLLAFGNYPYLIPYNKEQKALYDYMEKRVGALEASRLYTSTFYDLQDSDIQSNKKVLMNLPNTVSQKSKIKKELTNKDLKVFTDAVNSFPRMFFKGNSPKGLFDRETAKK